MEEWRKYRVTSCKLKRGAMKVPKNLRGPPEHGQAGEDRGSILPRLSQQVQSRRGEGLMRHTFHLQIELAAIQFPTHALC